MHEDSPATRLAGAAPRRREGRLARRIRERERPCDLRHERARPLSAGRELALRPERGRNPER
jgi:hypothetical protein